MQNQRELPARPTDSDEEKGICVEEKGCQAGHGAHDERNVRFISSTSTRTIRKITQKNNGNLLKLEKNFLKKT